MLDRRNLHVKVQELADCYKGTDPLKEMCLVLQEEDPGEGALKWIALAVLHGVSSNARKVRLEVTAEGDAVAVAEYRRARLPSPGAAVGRRAVEALRRIAHFDKDEEEGPLAFGWGAESLELQIKVKRGKDGDSVELEFPK